MMFFVNDSNLFGFRISILIKNCESDQGTALKVSVEKQRMQHLACLRHLIASFKTSTFSEQVSNLVHAECQTDFEELQKAYSDSWDSISDEQKKQELNDILKKVGLGMVKEKDDSGNVKEKVKPVNLNRWKQVSMIESFGCHPAPIRLKASTDT